MSKLNLSYLENPEIFNINRLEATSDHKYYKNVDEVKRGISSFKYYLNGSWKFNYSRNLNDIISYFYEEDYSV